MDFLLPEIAVAEKILRSVIVYGFLLVILVLIVRPEGLFGERGREV